MKKANLPFNCESCPSKGAGIFCDLEQMELDNVSKQKVVNKYKKGQTLFVQGNPPYGLYCLSEGNIKLTRVGPDGKDSILRVCKAGDVLGHRSILSNQNYNATATAIDDAVVCFIDKKYILSLLKEKPAVATQLMSKLSRDLGASEDRIVSFYQRDVRERLAELLLLLSQSHGVNEEKGIKIDIKLTREEMASLIGTASETLIRFLSEFKEEGLVAQEGKTLYIADETRLIEFAGLDN
jgi:CRP-like cAMP-binding protein